MATDKLTSEIAIEIVEEEEVDPYAGMSPGLTALCRMRDAKPSEAAERVQFSEEANPAIMSSFISGPFVLNPDGSFDCTFHHPVLGDLPFTAAQYDVEPYGRAAYAYIKNVALPSGGVTFSRKGD